MKQVLIERGGTYADILDNSVAFDRIMRGLGVDRAPNMNTVMFACMSNIATKLARFATGDAYHEDTFIDLANYSVLIAAHHRRMKVWRQEPDEASVQAPPPPSRALQDVLRIATAATDPTLSAPTETQLEASMRTIRDILRKEINQ